jgi:hypothetical protein
MKIQLKRSNVLENSSAKEPTAAQMEYGELAVNYNEADPAIFLKDSNNAIIRIAGAGSEGAPVVGDGQITINQGGTEVATFTVNQTGDTEVNLSEGAIYTAEAGKGIAINASNEIRIGDDWSNIPVLQ